MPATPKPDSSRAAALAPSPVDGQQRRDQQEREAAETAAAAAAAAAAAEQQAAREQAEQERAASARRRASPLYRVTPNERIVHEMLLSGQEGGLAFLEPGELEPEAAAAVGAPSRLATGRGSAPGAARPPAAAGMPPPPAPSEEEAAAEDVRRSVVNTVEQAFFDALAEGLRRGRTEALASLLLDARDQLAALLPQHPPCGGSGASGRTEGAQVLADLREKLDAVSCSSALLMLLWACSEVPVCALWSCAVLSMPVLLHPTVQDAIDSLTELGSLAPFTCRSMWRSGWSATMQPLLPSASTSWCM